jgi:kynurenine formamidase
MRRRNILTIVLTLLVTASVGYMVGSASGSAVTAGSGGQQISTPAFSRVVFLSHRNSPQRVPVFPGDPAFRMSTAFTVPVDGFYLQYVKEGEHTGTHYSAPCHFHVHALCAEELDPGDFVLPAVVVDVRDKVAKNVDYHVTVADLKAWQNVHGPLPKESAVLLRTGCDRFWGPQIGRHVPTYYNCGSADGRFRQPGFAKGAVKWLIDQGVLGVRGALGTDTFGPDPGDDPNFVETALTLHRHRFTLENLTHLGRMPVTGGWVVIGGPRNRHGSGAPSTIFGLIP